MESGPIHAACPQDAEGRRHLRQLLRHRFAVLSVALIDLHRPLSARHRHLPQRRRRWRLPRISRSRPRAGDFRHRALGAGYRTAMLGKYLNGYLPAKHPPAPGWTSGQWQATAIPSFNYNLNQDGRIVHYGNEPTDYLTDVLSGLAVGFIKRSAGQPFLIEVATFAPHAPYTPAPRDPDALPGLRAPRTPAFDAAPDANAPQWLRAHQRCPMPT